MYLGRVIGTIWATRKYESVTGYKMLFVQPINAKLISTGEPLVALDTVGAGPGEIVYYITSCEAVIPLDVDMAPVDASIVGIVDSLYSES
jgi:ethanolamine utilization protein EutN